MTTFIQTLLSCPISTSPMTCALWSIYAVEWTFGRMDRYGRSTGGIISEQAADSGLATDAGLKVRTTTIVAAQTSRSRLSSYSASPPAGADDGPPRSVIK